MIHVSLQWDRDVLAALREAALAYPRQVKLLVGSLARGPLAQETIRKLATPAPKPAYPLRWKSDKQRRYVLWMLRRSGNLPYKRTNRMVLAWRIVVTSAENAEITVENNSRAVQYVQGDWQQPMHIGRWQAAAPIIVEAEIEFQDALIDGWYRITKAGK